MSIVFVPQNIVNVKNVIAILVIIAIILDTLAGLGKNSSRIARRLVFECGITDSVGQW